VSEKVHIGGERHGGGSPYVVGHREEEVDLLPLCTDSLSGWAGLVQVLACGLGF
jgi:hypothetical protein